MRLVKPQYRGNQNLFFFFLINKHIKRFLFGFTHSPATKERTFPLCILDAKLSALRLVWARVCTHLHIQQYARARVQTACTLLQPKSCCPFILQVMANCELHSTCTEFTVQMNSNEQYIEMQQLSILGLCGFVLLRYFLGNIAETILLILASWSNLVKEAFKCSAFLNQTGSSFSSCPSYVESHH